MLADRCIGWFNVATFGNPKEVSPTSKYLNVWLMYSKRDKTFYLTTGSPAQFPLPSELATRMTDGLPHEPRMGSVRHELDEWGRILNLEIRMPRSMTNAWFAKLETVLGASLKVVLRRWREAGKMHPWEEVLLPKSMPITPIVAGAKSKRIQVWEMYDPWERIARLAFDDPNNPNAPHLHDSKLEIVQGLGGYKVKGTKSYWLGSRPMYVEAKRTKQPIQYQRHDIAEALGTQLALAIETLLKKDVWVLWRPTVELYKEIPLFRAKRERPKRTLREQLLGGPASPW